jgi:hypothetical protein
VKKGLAVLALVAAAYLILGEVAWRSDFFAALDEAQHGRPLLALVEGCFFLLRLLLLLLGPPLLAAGLVFRLTKS